MIEADLRRALTPLQLDDHALDGALVALLESLADADPHVSGLVHDAHAWVTAGHGLTPVVAGVLRERLVRCDAWTTTWIGVESSTGTPAMVRALRPHAARDPVLRRALARDGRRLQPVLGGLRVHADALTITLPGPPFEVSPPGGHAGQAALVRLVIGTLADLARWEEAGLGPGAPSQDELIDDGDTIRLMCLTPSAAGDARAAMFAAAAALATWWDGADDHPISALIDALLSLPPARVADAAALATAALASTLAGERHGVARRAVDVRRVDEGARLAHLTERLALAVPPPVGRAAVGVDLEGRVLVVHHLDGPVLFGPADAEPAVVWSPEQPMDVSAARRVLRARGSAPVSDRLNREVGGDPAYVDRIGRWLDGQLQLRTLRRLLQHTG